MTMLGFRKIFTLFFSIIFLVILIFGWISYRYDQGFRETYSQILHTQQVFRQSAQVLLLSKDIRIGGVRYVATGDPDYRLEYQQAKDRLPGELELLAGLVRDSPAQELRVDSLRQLIGTVGRFTVPLMAMAEEGQRASAIVADTILRQRYYLDSIINLIGSIQQDEQHSLFNLEASNQQSRLGFNRTLISLLGISFALLFSVFMLTLDNLAKRRKAEEKLLESEERFRAKVARDIKERKKAEEEIRVAYEKERELGELKSRFVSFASHEFKTPLSTILSSADLIEHYHSDAHDGKTQRHVARIKSNVYNLNRILNDFLDLEKLNEGKIRSIPESLDPQSLCRELVQEMGLACKEGQHIALVVQGSPGPLWTDPMLLRNVLINLLSNAIKYSGPGSTITLTIAQAAGGVELGVEDTGIGIPREDQTHLLEPFYRASNVEAIPGTGLGLHIVKRYLDLLGGSLTWDSQPGSGTRFRVLLPDAPHEMAPVDLK